MFSKTTLSHVNEVEQVKSFEKNSFPLKYLERSTIMVSLRKLKRKCNTGKKSY